MRRLYLITMHEFVSLLLRDDVFFGQSIGPHLSLEKTVMTMSTLRRPITKHIFTQALLDRAFTPRLQVTLDELNTHREVAYAMDTAMGRLLTTFAANVNGMGLEFEAKFQVDRTINHMRTHALPNIPFGAGGPVYDSLQVVDISGGRGIPISALTNMDGGLAQGGALGVTLTHQRRQVHLVLLFENGKLTGEDVDGRENHLNLMMGPLPHEPNVNPNLCEVVWVEQL